MSDHRNFTSTRDGPGDLASHGPRHDNDHAEITDIRILPTTSEILSTRLPYWPLYNPSTWHIQGLRGLLDRHFRLLREDNLGPLRDVLRTHLHEGQHSTDIYPANNVRTNEYKIQSIRVAYDMIDGFELHLSAKQPLEVAKRHTPTHREQWWVETNNLDWDRLVCLISQGHAIFCVVSRTTCRTFAQLNEKNDKTKKKRMRNYDLRRTLFNAKDLAYFVLQPVDIMASDIEFMLNARTNVAGGITVVEFPTLLLASFKPMLRTLQAIYTSSNVPLGEYLVGKVGKRDDDSRVDEHILPPVYAMNNFQFNLQPLTKNQSNLLYSARNEPDIKDICAKTNLDEGQTKALLNTLRRRLALIQGPPGTGKSYTGEAIIDVLLANRAKASLGPIICICQTNHALDQLLEHLYLRKGIRRIVRLGTQSKSPIIAELTLQKIMDARPALVQDSIVNGKRSKARKKAARRVIEALEELEKAEPFMRQELLRIIPELNQEFEDRAKMVDDGWSQRKINILREYDVIGVTTSGLARFRDWLSGVMSKVVLCEEAGEVLESHTLAALMPHTQHLILIGDHQQLRPMSNVHNFQIASPDGRPFSYDISLFERLVKPLLPTDKKLPYDTLEIQRRMHPIISQLVRSTVYPKLQDADSVKQYPELAGFKKRLFWFHHTKFEDGSNASRNGEFSFSNRFEVEVVKTVLGHINCQNVYGDGEIAVITPYGGQLRQLKIQLGTTYDISMNELDTAELEKHNMAVSMGNTRGRRRIRVATVDNFQGEEASVVIISLVRSNSERKCGFLNQSNRINVLLSRAKHGMIIVGNCETYSPNDVWWEIIQMMQAQGNVGTSFELQCPRHKDMTVLASTAQHFTAGGCTEKCDRPLMCGHRCAGSCHPEVVHNRSKCQFRCDAAFACSHACSHLCHHGRPCGPCTECQSCNGDSIRMIERVQESNIRSSQAAKGSARTVKLAPGHTDKLVDKSLFHVTDELAKLDFSISHPLVKFISASHKRLVAFELALLDEQESLKNVEPSTEVLRMVKRGGELAIKGLPNTMIQSIHDCVSGRYDGAVRLMGDINQYLREVMEEEQRFREMYDPGKQDKQFDGADHVDPSCPLQLQCMLSTVVLLIRCNVVILADYLSLRRRGQERKTIVSIDLTGFFRLCQFVEEHESNHPRHEAEAHILMGEMIVIAGEVSEQQLDLSGSNNTAKAEAHLRKALEIVLKHPCLGYLVEDIQAVMGEVSGSTFGSVVTSEAKRATWHSYAEDFQEEAYLHVCAVGHPFTIAEETSDTIYCRECDAPVGEHTLDSMDGGTGTQDESYVDLGDDVDSNVDSDVEGETLSHRHSQESLLVDI